MDIIPQNEVDKKPRVPPWFRVYGLNVRLLEAIPPEKAGRAFLAASRYFESGGAKVPAFDDPQEQIAFQAFRLGVDDSLAEYAAKIRGGKNSAEQRRKTLEDT